MTCFYSDKCNHKDCDKAFCTKKFKLDFLYNKSLLSEHQRKRTELKVDEDGTDLEAFQFLSHIETNIEEFVETGRNLFIHSPICGNGKAQPDNALILTKSGYVKLKDIAVGDAIYGEDGQLYQIIGKFDRGVKSIYKVYFQDGTSTECCNEHLWTVFDHKDRQTKTIT